MLIHCLDRPSETCPGTVILMTKSRVQVDNLFAQTADSLSHWLNFLVTDDNCRSEISQQGFLMRLDEALKASSITSELGDGGVQLKSTIHQPIGWYLWVSVCLCFSLFYPHQDAARLSCDKTPKPTKDSSAESRLHCSQSRLKPKNTSSCFTLRCQSWQSGECKLVHVLLEFTSPSELVHQCQFSTPVCWCELLGYDMLWHVSYDWIDQKIVIRYDMPVTKSASQHRIWQSLGSLAGPRDAGELIHFLQLSSETVLEFANGLVGHFHEVCRPIGSWNVMECEIPRVKHHLRRGTKASPQPCWGGLLMWAHGMEIQWGW